MMENNQIKRQPRRQSPVQKNRNRQGIYLTVLLAAVILAVLLLGLVTKDREFSETENRMLAQRPALTREALADGSWFQDFGTYLADQFPGRDLWVSLNAKLTTALGSRESGGVYLCADDYLMQISGQPNEEQFIRNLKAMEAFATAHEELNVVASVVPNAVTVLSEKLPANAPVRDQKQDLRDINKWLNAVAFVDVTDALLSHSDEQLFYRTDHHWTSLAAAYAFEQIAPALDLTAPELRSYTRYTVSTTFEGTLSSKAGSHKVTDTVEVFAPDTQITYFVKYPDGSEICSMYDRKALEAKDHYTVFFGGNYDRVDITTSADTGRSLLVFKDSYANCFLQFLYPYFDHITMVDPRYYYDNLQTVLTGENITDVLFLYNLDTFLADTSLADVLGTT